MQTGPTVLKPKLKPQIPALTGLRFFAAFFILFAHACDWCAQFQDSQIRAHFGLMAMYGMPLFFVLSGFVIHYNYRELFAKKPLRVAVGQFVSARVARLFPLYAFLLVVAILADNFTGYAVSHPETIGDVALYFLTLTQSWFYILWDGKLMATSLFPLAWSISTEAFFYVAYIIVVFALLKIARPRSALVISVAYAIAAMALLLVPAYRMGLVFSGGDQFYRWLFYFSPYVRIFEFLMGCLAAHAFVLIQSKPLSPREHRVGFVMLVTALAFLLIFGLMRMGFIVVHPINAVVNHLTQNFFFAPAIAIVIFCVSRYETAFSRFMSLPGLVILGETSYSIYLVHTWTLRLFNHPPPPLTLYWGLEAIARVLVAMVFTLVVAYGTYRVIEVPSRTWLRARLAKWLPHEYPEGVKPDRLPGMAAP